MLYLCILNCQYSVTKKELEDPKLYICNYMNVKRSGVPRKCQEKSLMRRFGGSSLITQSDIFTNNILAVTRGIHNGLQYNCNFNVRQIGNWKRRKKRKASVEKILPLYPC